jgi:hypothetical protein
MELSAACARIPQQAMHRHITVWMRAPTNQRRTDTLIDSLRHAGLLLPVLIVSSSVSASATVAGNACVLGCIRAGGLLGAANAVR